MEARYWALLVGQMRDLERQELLDLIRVAHDPEKFSEQLIGQIREKELAKPKEEQARSKTGFSGKAEIIAFSRLSRGRGNVVIRKKSEQAEEK